MLGYTLHIANKNKAADQTKVGVQLGKICIERNIPTSEIARIAGVSRVTVYAWFTGRYSPKPELAERLLKHLTK